MLSSSKSIRPRSLQHPAAWALRLTSTPSLLVLRTPSNVQTLYRRSTSMNPCRRSFSCGRRRQWGYSNSPGPYKLFGSRLQPSKDGRCSSLHHNYFNDRGHSIYRYLSSHGWRLSNSWGRPGYGWGNFNKPSKSGKSNEDKDGWYETFQETQAAIEKDFQEFKKMVDADPYGMLFGWRNPYLERRSADQSKDENTNRREATSTMKGRQHDDRRASATNPVDKGRAQERAPQPSLSHSELNTTSKQESEIEEYEFDPITMRKVPKRPARPASAPTHKKAEPNKEFIIPVKPFVTTGSSSLGRTAHSPAPPRHEVPTTKQTGQKWLAQEGFGASNQAPETLGSNPQQQSEHIHPTYSKIETALDRYLRIKRTQAKESSTNDSPSKLKGEESTKEDVDLLRASDVRASAGLCGRSPKETNNERQERRKTLENDYERRPQYLDSRLKDEVASRQAQSTRSPLQKKRSPISSHPGHSAPSLPNFVNKSSVCEPSTLSRVGTEQWSERQMAELSRREAINRKKDAAKSVHKEEVKAQKAAMEALEMRSGSAGKTAKVSPVQSQESGEGDMASNVCEFVGRGRWYKQQAPHAMKESELKLQQMAKDRAFVREIRSIYEDEYGTIDTQHRQPSRQAELEDNKHAHEVIGESFKQPSKQVEQKAKEKHGKEARDQSSRALPDRLPRASPHASKTDSRSERLPYESYNFDTIGFQPLHPPRQRDRNDKESTQEAIDQSKGPSPRALPDMPDASSSSNNFAEPQHVENRELERSGISEAIPKVANESSIELPASAEKGTGKPDSPTTTASLSSDESGSSSTSKPISPEASDSTKPSLYRILAYDPSTQRVTSAKTTSLTAPADEKTLSLVEALSRLAAPAKFLPHFASLQNSGYEIVSGSTNVLIFKKVRPSKPVSHVAEEPFSATIEDKYPWHTNPIDGTTTQTGNFASPTGFVNHDAILPPSEGGQPMGPYPWSTKPNDKVTRQEEVFSGSRPRWEDHRAERMSKRLRNKQRRAERRKRTLKRMIWVGVWVAGCCYAVGVGLEFLRA
ncbi:hypothetical protein MMC22_004016 [Lobaria immixta]|nr:hypothetical protein [Lobaria immixta]